MSGQPKKVGKATVRGVEWHIMSYSMPFSFWD